MPAANRIYSGVCKDKWVEINAYPWNLKKLDGDSDEIETGRF